jgi:hypothetical protein
MKTTQARPKPLLIACVLIVASLAFGIGLFIGYSIGSQQGAKTSSITSYADCVDAGYPIQTSYPERCTIPDGRTFTNIPAGR